MPRRTETFRLLSVVLLAGFFFTAANLTPLRAQSGAGAIPASSASGALAALGPISHADRLAVRPDLSAQAQLRGHLPAWVRPANLIAEPVALGAPLHVSLVLARSAGTQAAFEKLLAAQQEPGSPLFHHWLTPAEIGTIFGPTDHDLGVVERWATSQGLHVDSVAPSRMILELSGTTAGVGNAFRVSFAYYMLAGAPRLSATSEPSVPAALVPLTAAVDGLVEIPLEPQNHAVAVARPAPGPAAPTGRDPALPHLTLSATEHFLSPADFAAIYDLKSVYSSGNTGATVGGKPQHIAVIGRSRVAATDISEFATATGIGAYTLNTVLASIMDPGTTGNGDQTEATLDIDRALSTAPGAQTDLVISGSAGGHDGAYVAAAYNVNQLLDPVMTLSFSNCEANVGAAGVNLWNTLFASAAAEGISVFVASGDAGAAGCYNAATPNSGQVASINYICASSYATCVGGTEFTDTANPAAFWSATDAANLQSVLGYIPEGAWNEPSSTTSTGATAYAPSASGGGVSQYIAKPSWQTGVGVPADGFRDVPDVSLSASGHNAYFACLAYAGGDCSKNYFEAVFGTSAAAPAMAGIAALLNTAAGSAQGNLNPLLYRLAASPTANAFHDVTVPSSGVANCTALPSTCNNSSPGPVGLSGGFTGYLVTTGYDLVTGLGSPAVAHLLTANPSFALSSSPGALTLQSGSLNGNTASVVVSSVNGFSGLVSLSCTVGGLSAGTQPTCSVAPSAVTLASGGIATAVVSIASVAAQSGSAVAARGPLSGAPGKGALLALLFCVPGLRRRRRSWSLLAAGFAGAAVLALTGCGSGSIITAGSAKSSAGAYTLTITGSSVPSTAIVAASASTSVSVTIN